MHQRTRAGWAAFISGILTFVLTVAIARGIYLWVGSPDFSIETGGARRLALVPFFTGMAAVVGLTRKRFGVGWKPRSSTDARVGALCGLALAATCCMFEVLELLNGYADPSARRVKLPLIEVHLHQGRSTFYSVLVRDGTIVRDVVWGAENPLKRHHDGLACLIAVEGDGRFHLSWMSNRNVTSC